VDAYPHCTAMSATAHHFLMISASSAASKHLFSVTNRLVNKQYSCLLSEHFRIEISN